MNNNELKQKLQEAKDFWNTPFDELIEQGYGTIEDPVDEFYETTTLGELRDLLKNAPKPGVCHTKKNVAKRQYITYLRDAMDQKIADNISLIKLNNQSC